MTHGQPRTMGAPTTTTPAMDVGGWRRVLRLHTRRGDMRREPIGRNNGRGIALTAGGVGGGGSARLW
jgi:hypothetical protein